MRAREKWRNKPIEELTFHHPQVAIDLSYGGDMTSKSIASTVTQLNHLYGALRKSERPLKTHLCSLTGEFQTKLEMAGVNGWKVFPHAEPYYSVFDPSQIIYLSPDSPNILEKIDETKVYIIGGLADHNHLTGLSNKRASEREIQTAKLPLTTYLQDFPNKSLNVNHVFEIIMDVANHGDWKKALEVHVPQRKGFKKLKQKTPKQPQNETQTNPDGDTSGQPETEGHDSSEGEEIDEGVDKKEVDLKGEETIEQTPKRRKIDQK